MAQERKRPPQIYENLLRSAFADAPDPDEADKYIKKVKDLEEKGSISSEALNLGVNSACLLLSEEKLLNQGNCTFLFSNETTIKHMTKFAEILRDLNDKRILNTVNRSNLNRFLKSFCSAEEITSLKNFIATLYSSNFLNNDTINCLIDPNLSGISVNMEVLNNWMAALLEVASLTGERVRALIKYNSDAASYYAQIKEIRNQDLSPELKRQKILNIFEFITTPPGLRVEDKDTLKPSGR